MDIKNSNTPKRRFPGFEGAWKQKEFGRMFQKLQTGTNLLGSEQGRGIPLLKMGNIQRGYWNLTKLERLDQEIERENIIKYGDFLFNTRNTLELVGKGATWFIREGLYGFNSNLARVTFENVDTIFFNYLYNIPENIQQVKSRAVGTTSVAAVYPKDMVSIKFQLPTIDEQKKLGNFFQTIDSLISLHQHKLDKLKDLKKAYLTEMFPAEGECVPKRRFPGFEGEWEMTTLGETVKVTMGQSPDGTTYSDAPGDYILVQGNSDLENGWVKPRIWTTQTTKSAEKGDIIMSVRAPAGQVGRTGYNVVIGRGVAAIKGNEFIYQLLVKLDIDAYWKQVSSGSTFDSLNSDNIKNAEIKVPSIEEQEKIGNFFHKLDNSIFLEQQKLDKLNDLKKAYLNELFV